MTPLASAARALADAVREYVNDFLNGRSVNVGRLEAALARYDAAQGGERVRMVAVRTSNGEIHGFPESCPTRPNDWPVLCILEFTPPPQPEVPTVSAEVCE